MESGDKIVSLTDHKVGRRIAATRPNARVMIHGTQIRVRLATEQDIPEMQGLFAVAYRGKYSFDYAIDPIKLAAEIDDLQHHLWLVAEDLEVGLLAGAIYFIFDPAQRLGKAAGAVVLPKYRNGGLGQTLLKTGVNYLTKTLAAVDVIYGTTRTVSIAPTRMVEEVGFHPLGIFPNAIYFENLEHLNLDIYLTEAALARRRKKPYLFPPFLEVYNIARKQLGLEKAALVTERAPLKLSPQKIRLGVMNDEKETAKRFDQLVNEQRLANRFFPFHRPNQILMTEDGGTEVFVCYDGEGKQASILGYRTDRVDLHDLLDSVAATLQRAGAGYVDLLVDAYDFILQQAAFTARFVPSAYFPAMKLNDDGLRDDFFVLSRTFRLLDFSGIVLTGTNLKFLRAYIRYYHELYIQPILGEAPKSSQ